MDINLFKSRLETERTGLETQLKTLAVRNPEVSEDWVEKSNDLDTVSADPNDVADRTEEYDTRRAELAELEGRWNDIKDALQKIETGTYGQCEVCGQSIEEDRLEANPAARTCKTHMQ